MEIQSKSQSSLDTISIKFTQNHLPSSTVIKTSQDHISLTYTVSLQNISQQNISLKQIRNNDKLSIQVGDQTIECKNQKRYYEQDYKQEEIQTFDKDVFKKKSILKISNIDFSPYLRQLKQQQSPQRHKTKKFVVRPNNPGVIYKNKNTNYETIAQNKPDLKFKQTVQNESSENFTQNLLLRTTKFYSLKNDKVIEPVTLRKKCVSIRKQIQGANSSASTDRKPAKFPIIKGSNCHINGSASVTQRRKAFTSHENMQNSQRNQKNFTQKMILGRTYKMGENDQKAKKYLKKIIQNRNSVIHFSQNKHRISRQFKENSQDRYF